MNDDDKLGNSISTIGDAGETAASMPPATVPVVNADDDIDDDAEEYAAMLEAVMQLKDPDTVVKAMPIELYKEHMK